jgi:hypothetical protein
MTVERLIELLRISAEDREWDGLSEDEKEVLAIVKDFVDWRIALGRGEVKYHG